MDQMESIAVQPPSIGQRVAASELATIISHAAERTSIASLTPTLGLDATALAAPPPGVPSPNALNSMLNGVAAAPAATTVVTVPSAPASGDVALIQEVQVLDSYIAVLTAIVMYTKHPEPYDLSKPDQAAQFVVDLADARNYVVTGGEVKAIPMYLPLGQATTQHIEKSTTSAELHVELLTAMFAGFGLPEKTLTELDSILTEVANSLKALQLSFSSEKQTLNSFVSFYHLVPVEGSEPPVHEMQASFIYLQMSQSSWKASAGKSSVEHFSLDMLMTKSVGTMSAGIVAANSSTIINALKGLTEHDPTQISEMTGMRGVKI
jgi:hypothetical protein